MGRARWLSLLVAAALLASCDEKGPEAFAPFLLAPEALFGRIEGRVEANGQGIAAEVGLTGPVSRTTQGGTDGRFEFRDLAPGSYLLDATASEFECGTVQVLLAAQQARVADISCTPAPGDLEVVVIAQSQPLSGATVSVAGATTRTGVTAANGSTTFVGLPAGPYAIGVQREGFECPSAQADVPAGGAVQALVECLPTAGALRVRVVDRQGIPILGVTVRRSGSDEPGTTGADGIVEFDLLAPGNYEVLAEASTMICTNATASVTAGDTTQVTLRCDRIEGDWRLDATRTSDTCPPGVNPTSILIPSAPYRVVVENGVARMVMETEPQVEGPLDGNSFSGSGQLAFNGLTLRKGVEGEFRLNSILRLQGPLVLEWLQTATGQHICASSYAATHTKLP